METLAKTALEKLIHEVHALLHEENADDAPLQYVQ
jgi:hypothetical protein